MFPSPTREESGVNMVQEEGDCSQCPTEERIPNEGFPSIVEQEEHNIEKASRKVKVTQVNLPVQLPCIVEFPP